VPSLKAGFEKAACLSSDELRPFWGKAAVAETIRQTATAAFQFSLKLALLRPWPSIN
jgi:hypothetical protein